MLNEIRNMFAQWGKHKGAFGLISSLIASNRKKIILLIFLSGVSSVITVLCSIFVRLLIDSAGSDGDIIRLLIYCLLLVASCVCAYFLVYHKLRTGEELYRQTQRNFLKSALYQEWMTVSRFQTGDLISRMKDDGSQIVGFAANTYPGVVSAIVKLIVVIPIMAAISPILLLFLLIMALISAIAMGAIRAKILPVQKKAREEQAKTESLTTETFSNLLTVRSFGKEKYFLKKWDASAQSRIDAVNKRNGFQAASDLTFDILTTVGYFAVFAWALLMLGHGKLSYGTLSMLLVLQGYIQGPIAEIVEGLPQLIWTSVSADRMNEIILTGSDEKSELSDTISGEAVGIKAENISFSYGSKKIFDQFSFDIEPGEFITLQGASGAGKTTLLMLILDLLHPQEGTLSFYNNKGEKAAAGSGMRKLIGYVPQKNTLFKGSIRENICLCVSSDMETDESVIKEALYLADAWDFVSSLENGIDTELGERGCGISEGQAQRLAIARALIAKPDILIFDEATSALDLKTEKNIIERISSLEKRPTLIFATHREAADEFADRIIYI